MSTQVGRSVAGCWMDGGSDHLHLENPELNWIASGQFQLEFYTLFILYFQDTRSLVRTVFEMRWGSWARRSFKMAGLDWTGHVDLDFLKDQVKCQDELGNL